MSIYTYEAVFHEDEDGINVSFTQFDEAVTWGKSIDEAASRASECLRLVVTDYLEEGRPLPKPRFNKKVGVIVSVEVSSDDIALQKCITVKQTAAELGVSSARVSQLLKSGALQEYWHGGKRLVTIESVRRRLKNPPPSHRPSK